MRERRDAAPYLLLVILVSGLGAAGYAGYALYPRFDLPAAEGATLLLLAAAAGVASFFSPCAFGLLVTVLAREVRGKGWGVDQGAAAGLRRGCNLAHHRDCPWPSTLLSIRSRAGPDSVGRR